MNRDELEPLFRARRERVLAPMAPKIQEHLVSYFKGYERIDRITARAKAVDRFVDKALKIENGQRKYSEPLQQIQDQIGARIVTFYLADVDAVAAAVDRYFRKIEDRTIVPDSEAEFGYFGKHYILFIPEDILVDFEGEGCPKFFELQVKTLFQYAWAEAEHDIGYKPSIQLTPDQKRKIAFTAAQAWGADRIFAELSDELGSVAAT